MKFVKIGKIGAMLFYIPKPTLGTMKMLKMKMIIQPYVVVVNVKLNNKSHQKTPQF